MALVAALSGGGRRESLMYDATNGRGGNASDVSSRPRLMVLVGRETDAFNGQDFLCSRTACSEFGKRMRLTNGILSS